MTDHTALISSLEKASEGSRELDALVWVAATGATFSHLAEDAHLDRVTTSIDAIVALIERKLPGWHRQSGTEPGGATASAWLTADDGRVTTGEQFAKTEPLALCIALLHALQHQGGEP